MCFGLRDKVRVVKSCESALGNNQKIKQKQNQKQKQKLKTHFTHLRWKCSLKVCRIKVARMLPFAVCQLPFSWENSLERRLCVKQKVFVNRLQLFLSREREGEGEEKREKEGLL